MKAYKACRTKLDPSIILFLSQKIWTQTLLHGILHLLSMTAKKYLNTLKPQHVRETRGKISWKVKNSLRISSPVLVID